MKKVIVLSCCIVLAISLVLYGNEIQAADKYPEKPITCIIAGEAGSGGDINTRGLFETASPILGKPIMVVNKPGAGQAIGYREIYQAKPDGYTIGVAYLSIITLKLQGRFPQDHRDFTHMGQYFTMNPVVFASTKSKNPFKTIQELFSFAKAHPGEVSMATTAKGGPYWTAAMLIEEATGLKFNIIPQEGSGGFVMGQVAGGHVELGVAGFPEAKPQIEAGNVVPLALIGPQRYSGMFSHVPTLKEVGYDVSLGSFGSIIGPPKMQKDVTEILVKTFKAAALDPKYQEFTQARYHIPVYFGPEEFISFCEKERNAYQRIFEKAGLLKE